MHPAERDPLLSLEFRRNCSISPHALLRLLGLLAGLSLGIGIAFALAGAPMVLPFTGMETIALAAAFCVYSRHACDYERIGVCRGRLVIEVRDGPNVTRTELDCAWIRITEQRSACDYRVAVLARGEEIEIGRHLVPARRQELAALLRGELLEGPGRAAGPQAVLHDPLRERRENDEPRNG